MVTGEQLTGIPRYLNDITCSKDNGSNVGKPVKIVRPVPASCDITLDLVTEISSLWFLKKILVVFIKVLRAVGFLPRTTRSSAKKMHEILVVPRLSPFPDELSSCPRLLMNKLKRRGERLQPRDISYLIICLVILSIPCLTPRVSQS